MKTTKFFKLSAFLFFFLLAACISNKNQLNIVSRNFGEEIIAQQNLVINFDKEIAIDSIINRWDTTAYFTISPAVIGKYRWNTRKELVFSPQDGFKPATSYSLTINEKKLKSLSPQITISDDVYEFHTAAVALVNQTGYWRMSEKFTGRAALVVELNFNYKISVQQLMPLIKLLEKENSLKFSIENGANEQAVNIVMDNIAKEEVGEKILKVVIAAGLKPDGGSIATTLPIEAVVNISSPSILSINQAIGEFDNTEGYIHVYASQAIDPATIDANIKINPSLPFTSEVVENGFLLKGAFVQGSTYELTITSGIKGELGGELKQTFAQQVSFGEMQPSISFTNSKAYYLSQKSSKNIALNIVNIPSIDVKVWKIYQNNILHYIKHNRYNDYYYDEEGEYSASGLNYSTYNMDGYGDMVYSRTYNAKDLAKQNGVHLLNLSFDDINNFKGTFIVQVSSTDDQWRRATKLVAISDIGLIVKQSNNQVYVFANSIKDAKSLAGVNVSLISSNNQTVMQGATNAEGVAVFNNLTTKANNFQIKMVGASLGSDFNYLLYSDTRVNNSRFDVGGRRANASGYMAFIYGDRNIYRPGETIHINTIVRNEAWQFMAGMPIKVRITLPNGRELKTVRGTLNHQGAFTLDVPLSTAAVTGFYSAEVFTANDLLLQSYSISVEEFIPDRIDVKFTTDQKTYTANGNIKTALMATNLFGPPAANRKYEIELKLSKKQMYVKDFPNFNFTINGEKKVSLESDLRQGTTDEQGAATAEFAIDEKLNGTGLLHAKCYATVFDETGRPVNRIASADIYMRDIYYGIGLREQYLDVGSKSIIPIVAVNKLGKPLATTARVKIVQYDWYSAVEQDEYGSGYRYVSKKKEIIIQDQVVQLTAGVYNFAFTPRGSGEYEVRVAEPEEENYVSGTFWAYGFGYTSNNSFEVNTEGQIDIVADKTNYTIGDVATVVFKTPFNGRMLITTECNNVLSYHYLNTDKKSAVFKLPIKKEFLPNVYLTATLFRPLDDGAIPLTTAHGFACLMVQQNGNRLPLTIKAPEKIRSKSKQTITIQSAPLRDIEVTVAVVDEGILQLKNFATPDPYSFFYQKKALMVDAYDVYPYLLPDLKLKRSSTGGDGYDLEKRVNPLSNKRVNLVALWSGHLRTNAAGVAKYTFDVPQFSGDLRVMACAYKDAAFGSADAHIKVADPIVISAGIPRFLSPGDTLTVPTTITNTTTKATKASAQIKTTGSLRVVDQASFEVNIPPQKEQKVIYKVVAANAIGQGTIEINTTAFNEVFKEITDITVRPSTSLLKIADAGELKQAGVINLQNDFIQSSTKAKLLISRNPLVKFSKQLNYLLGYPFGCVEQTTSKAFPQLYYADLVSNMEHKSTRGQNPAFYVQEAIRKLEGMQLYNGALSYWPGGEYESWWGTIYAVHFLVEAQKAGYEVNKNILDNAMAYLAKKVNERAMDNTYAYYDNQQIRYRAIYAHENIYSLYILALYAKADLPSMNFFKANLNSLTVDSKYLLACAYLSIGDRASYQAILPKAITEKSTRALGGSFYSYLRDEALVLNALLETDPENNQIISMVRHLSDQISKEPYLNSQEAAFSFLAMGKYMRKVNKSNATAAVSIEGKPMGTVNEQPLLLTQNIAGKKVDVNVSGGVLYYFYEIEGLSASGNYVQEDKYLQARKSFFNRQGKAITLTDIQQGDLIVIKLSLTSLERSRVENVVLTDMLPAGFEIENPRIKDLPDMNWITDASNAAYFDIRDDRINYFTEATLTTKNFYYMVRAVSTGKFKMGPVSADAMYDGAYHSYHGATTITIK